MRIKDIASEFCYKFRINNQIPVLQSHQTDISRLLFTFSGDYVEDLYKFVAALEDSRFYFRQDERQVTL